jgi:hypothetical protein
MGLHLRAILPGMRRRGPGHDDAGRGCRGGPVDRGQAPSPGSLGGKRVRPCPRRAPLGPGHGRAAQPLAQRVRADRPIDEIDEDVERAWSVGLDASGGRP